MIRSKNCCIREPCGCYLLVRLVKPLSLMHMAVITTCEILCCRICRANSHTPQNKLKSTRHLVPLCSSSTYLTAWPERASEIPQIHSSVQQNLETQLDSCTQESQRQQQLEQLEQKSWRWIAGCKKHEAEAKETSLHPGSSKSSSRV